MNKVRVSSSEIINKFYTIKYTPHKVSMPKPSPF